MVDGTPQRGERRSRRFSSNVLLWYCTIDAERQAEGIARSFDVSAEGLGFVLGRLIPVGTRLFLEVNTSHGNLSAVGTVRHCRAEKKYYRLGVSLEIVPPNDQPTLASLIEE